MVGMQRIILHTDGGARGNPGPSGAGYVIFDEHGATIKEGATFLGHQTNNFAEYTAVILGLKMIVEHFGKAVCKDLSVVVRMDSELVCRQLNGIYKVKHPNIIPLYQEVRTLTVKHFPHIAFEHVRREHNKHADKLSNDAMDLGA
jgi:ribonuclease HI